MNEFSKKSDKIVLSLSVFALMVSAALIIFSPQFINAAYVFLQKVLHREFSLDKWRASIESFFLIPAFLTVVINAVLFPKYSKLSKNIILFVLLGVVLFMITYTNAATAYMQACSDDASELLLGKECVIEKTILPRGWYYSTEIRFLYTQIFSAFAWIFTDSFTAVKTVQSFLSVCAFFLAGFYIMTALEIKKNWIKILCSTLLILPWSSKTWWVGAGFNYYIPHAIFSFVYAALFVRSVKCGKKKHIILFYAIAFISGLSTIRYILNFVLPLTIAVVSYEAFALSKSEAQINIKDFLLNNQKVKLVVLGLLFAGFGYVCNNVVLQKVFSFAEWNTMGYNTLGSTTVADILRGIIHLFGYKDNIAVFTPGGVVNILVYFFIILLVAGVFASLKSKIDDSQKIFVIFVFTAITLNSWIYIHVDYTERYLYPIIAGLLVCLAIILDNQNLSFVRKWILGSLAVVVLLTSSFSTIQENFAKDENKKRLAVAQFLENSGYEFGYGTFAQSTVFNWLTHGKVTVGMLKKDKEIPYEHFFYDTYQHGEWLSPKWYYTKDWGNKPIFFIASQEEYHYYNTNKVFQKGKLVYKDDYFLVYEYENHEAFKHLYD